MNTVFDRCDMPSPLLYSCLGSRMHSSTPCFSYAHSTRSIVSLCAVSTNRSVQGDVVHPARMEMPRLRFTDSPKTSASRTMSAASKARAMRILFLTNAHNGMSQALYLNLTEQGHQVTCRHFNYGHSRIFDAEMRFVFRNITNTLQFSSIGASTHHIFITVLGGRLSLNLTEGQAYCGLLCVPRR